MTQTQNAPTLPGFEAPPRPAPPARLHPFGFPLGDNAHATCGNCGFAVERARGRNHNVTKCTKNSTASTRATDLDVTWRACVHFQPWKE